LIKAAAKYKKEFKYTAMRWHRSAEAIAMLLTSFSKGARNDSFGEAAELTNSIPSSSSWLSSLKSSTPNSVVSLAFLGLGEPTPHLLIFPPTSKFVQPLCSWLLYATHV
jgi:hypothetical protein